MFYELDGLETYLHKIIEDYMEFGVIETDVKMEISEIITPDILTLSDLKLNEVNQSKKLSVIYSDEIEENLLVENISKIDKNFDDPVNHKDLIKSVLESYRLTCLPPVKTARSLSFSSFHFFTVFLSTRNASFKSGLTPR